MLYDVKKIAEDELRVKKQEAEALLLQIKELSEEYDELSLKKSENNSLIASKKFNFIQKYITKRKEFKEYQNIIKSNDNIPSKLVELTNKIESLESELKEKENIPPFDKITENDIIEGYNEKLDNIKNATNFEEMGTNYDKAKQLLEENGIEVKFDSCKEALELASDEFANDEEFMKRAIKEDKNLINFDRTNSDELYIEYLSKLKESAIESKEKDKQDLFTISTNQGINNIDAIIEEIKNPSSKVEGKYKIPHEFLYESIRTTAGKDFVIDPDNKFRSDIFKEKFEDYEKFTEISNESSKYLKVDSTISQSLGSELEKLWTDPDNTFVIHNILRNYKNFNLSNEEMEKQSNDVINSIFSKGLKATNAMHELANGSSPALAATAVRKGQGISLMDVIDYNYAGGTYNIVMQIPNDAFAKNSKTPIWGTNDKDAIGSNREFYLLPEYVYGGFKANDSNAEIIKNDSKDKVNYRYTTYDVSSKNEYELIDNQAPENKIER